MNSDISLIYDILGITDKYMDLEEFIKTSKYIKDRIQLYTTGILEQNCIEAYKVVSLKSYDSLKYCIIQKLKVTVFFY